MAGRRDWTRETLAAGVRRGDRRALARAITLIENGDPLAYDLVAEIYADTGKAFLKLTAGATVDLARLPRRVNVVATLDGRARSVVFGLDGKPRFRVEHAAPYTLFGDGGGKYASGTFARGKHTLTARAFARSDGTSPLGPALSIT